MEEEKFGRHENGGGKIFGFAEANQETKLDAKSRIYDEVEIYNSQVINSIIRGNAVISNALIKNCLIDGDVIITDGKIFDSQISEKAKIIGSNTMVSNSNISGRARIFEGAYVDNATIIDASIYGGASVIGGFDEKLYFNGLFRIGKGIFHGFLPRFYRFSEMEISLTESINGFAYIGCRRMKMQEWIKKGKRLGKAHGWTPKAIELATLIFQEWIESPIMQGNFEEAIEVVDAQLRSAGFVKV